jgi:hypothetical protein
MQQPTCGRPEMLWSGSVGLSQLAVLVAAAVRQKL